MNEFPKQLSRFLGVEPERALYLYERLTAREKQVATMMAEGMSNEKIANELEISIKTLDIHRGNVKQKFDEKTSACIAKIVWVARAIKAAANNDRPKQLAKPAKVEG
jgi:DNA-binding CsgD family transcriptional regulator